MRETTRTRDIASDVLAAMNTTADPCVDFYEYACGGWMATHEIPEEDSRFSRSFNGITERNDKTILSILKDDKPEIVTPYFEACLKDEQNMDKLESVMADIIRAVYSHNNIGKSAGLATKYGAAPYFDYFVDINAEDPSTYIMNIMQGGISLPRTLYLNQDERSKKVIEAYKTYIANMTSLYNSNAVFPKFSSDAAALIVEIETQIAGMHLSNVELRDPFKTFNVYPIEKAMKAFEWLGLDQFVAALKSDMDLPATINVATPTFFSKLNSYIASLSADAKANYVLWKQVNAMIDAYPQSYRKLHFEFFGEILSGTPKAPTAEKRCVALTLAQLGMEVGKSFVKKVFPEESKTKALEMIHAIQSAMHDVLLTDDWMDETTTQKALTKLNMISFNIGYPDAWPEVKTDLTDTMTYTDMMIALTNEQVDTAAARIGAPIDSNLWGMNPATVNAYYNPTENKEVFPAAILQNPFFEADFPEAMNYGSIGVVEGHEQSHGFDDQGSLYDGRGKLESWWTNSSRAAFTTRAQCFIDQYNNFELYPGAHVNGELCLGENIADNSGARVSYKAYQEIIGARGSQPSIVSGLTNNQLFFVSYAQTWCSKTRKEEALRRLEQDVHSPPRFRVVGVVQNHEAFPSVFQCPANTPMNPDHKCKLF